jgi:hypothetical protein
VEAQGYAKDPHFLVAGLKGFIPTYGELHRRHMKEMSICPLCGHREESLYHCMVQCDHAMAFWEAAEEHFGVNIPRLHQALWSLDILDPGIVKRKDADIFVSVMWAIWTSRNKYTQGEVAYQPRRAIELVDELVRSLDLPPQEMPVQREEEVGTID